MNDGMKYAYLKHLNFFHLKYFTSLLFVVIFFTVFSCKKDDEIRLSGRYKMVFGYYDEQTDSGPTVVYSEQVLISRYLEFVDSSTVFLSDTIGFPGTFPVITSRYTIDGHTLYIDSALFSPFNVNATGGGVFTVERINGSSGLKNRYSY